MMKVLTAKLLLLILFLFLVCPAAMAQTETVGQGNKDSQDKRNPKDLPVTSEEKGEKSVLLKAIESITFEKVSEGIPGADRGNGGGFFSVRLKNSQKVLSLSNRFALNINTDLGVVVRDTESQKEPSSTASLKNRDTPSFGTRASCSAWS